MESSLNADHGAAHPTRPADGRCRMWRPYGFDPFLAPLHADPSEVSAFQTSIRRTAPGGAYRKLGIVEDVLDDGPGGIREEQGRTFRGQVQFHIGGVSPRADRQQGDLAGLHEEFSLDHGLPGAGRDAVSLQLHGSGTRTE